MNKRGFTLVELLAVIVVLAIILAIAVPGISSIIKNATKSAMESDAKLLLKTVDLKKLGQDTFNPLDYNDDLEGLLAALNLSGDNYENIVFTNNNGIILITVMGKNKWNGLTACGSYQNMKVSYEGCELDLTPPDITLNGEEIISLQAGQAYDELGATVTDNSGEEIKLIISGTVDINMVGTYTITYKATDSSGNTATKTRTVKILIKPADFEYTGSVQPWSVPVTGTYKLEVWGAQGGGTYGGKGGYAVGNITLTAGQILNVYVGGQYGYNGGGSAGVGARPASPGGGGTDIRLDGTELTDRIIVAGGGGGTSAIGCEYTMFSGVYGHYASGGNALQAGNRSSRECASNNFNGYGGGAATTVAGGFGGAGATVTGTYSHSGGNQLLVSGPGGGGGGGYYGGGGGGSGGVRYGSSLKINGLRGSDGSLGQGGAGANSGGWVNAVGTPYAGGGGGGGSSYVGGVTGGITKAGNEAMPSTGAGDEIGHTGNGYARITPIE